MYLVERIIEKCENSQNDWRLGATGGKSLRIDQQLSLIHIYHDEALGPGA